MNGAVLDSTFNFFFKPKYSKLFDQMLAPRFEEENLRLVQGMMGDAWSDFAQNPEEKGHWLMVQQLFAEGPYGLSAQVLAKSPGGYGLADLRA